MRLALFSIGVEVPQALAPLTNFSAITKQ